MTSGRLTARPSSACCARMASTTCLAALSAAQSWLEAQPAARLAALSAARRSAALALAGSDTHAASRASEASGELSCPESARQRPAESVRLGAARWRPPRAAHSCWRCSVSSPSSPSEYRSCSRSSSWRAIPPRPPPPAASAGATTTPAHASRQASHRWFQRT